MRRELFVYDKTHTMGYYMNEANADAVLFTVMVLTTLLAVASAYFDSRGVETGKKKPSVRSDQSSTCVTVQLVCTTRPPTPTQPTHMRTRAHARTHARMHTHTGRSFKTFFALRITSSLPVKALVCVCV